MIARANRTSGLPHTFLGNMQAFMAEASIWVTMVLMSGFFERHPKLKAAVFESDSTWLSFVLGTSATRPTGSTVTTAEWRP